MIRKTLSALVGKKPQRKTPNIFIDEIDDTYLWRCVDYSISKGDSVVTMRKKVKVVGYYGLCGFKLEERSVQVLKYLTPYVCTPDYLGLLFQGYTEVKEEES
jgi:hypothetical protein